MACARAGAASRVTLPLAEWTATEKDKATTKASAHPSRRSLIGLDWFVFCLADIQTGFGPFVSVYLTTQKWTQGDIGLVLTIGGIIGLIGRVPGGAVVDAARSERTAAALAVTCIGLSALVMAAWPLLPFVFFASILSAGANCVLTPAIAAISLGLVGHAAIGPRLGRNARFASLGTGIAAAGMGACGYLLSSRAVFFVTAALMIPTLIALSNIRAAEIDPVRAHSGIVPQRPAESGMGLRRLVTNRPLIAFAGATALFQFANAATLPLMGSIMTMRSADWAPVLIAACIVVPQVVVALLSPWVGVQAERWGRRPLLLLGFAALPLRCFLFANTPDPDFVVVVQALDGISAAVLGVLVPLVAADLARNTGRFNLTQGIIGTAVGIGASISTTFAGYITDHYGSHMAFLGLAAVATCAFLFVYLAMPETRPDADRPDLTATPNAAAAPPL
jgi:predicted MFS family arabinose efflux permease